MTETLTTSGAVKLLCGTNASTTIINSPTNMTTLINLAEGELCSATRVDWLTNWTSLSSSYSGAVNSACASKAAMLVIAYDMSGYTSRAEAQTMLDLLRDNYERALKYLDESKVKEKLGVI